MIPVPAADLRIFGRDCYGAMGVADAAADLIADSLVQADLWGHPSHGIMRLFWYGARFASGAMRTDGAVETVSDAGALAVMDAGDGPGQVAALAAMDLAVEKARAHGIGAVSVRNSGHFGTAMYFTRRAAMAGCVGFLATNASPAMAPWGGREKRVGNNPFSWAAPAGRYPPMMLDIANTAVARGKLYAAKARGDAIPEGWAIDADGRATTDPAAGIAGTILPMGGHKGYAISVLMDAVTGVLSGSAFGPGVTGPYMAEGRSGVGHLAVAIDIRAVRPLGDFVSDMERMIDGLRAVPLADSIDRIWYPGEREADSAERLDREGVPLPEAVVEELRSKGAALGVAFPA